MASTGGVRLTQMIKDGKVDRPYLWLDAYNQAAVPSLTGTIMTRIDASNHYSVSVPHTKDRTPKDNNIMIAQVNITRRECRLFDIRKLTPRETGRLMGVREHCLDLMEQSGLRPSALYKLFGNSIVVDVLAAIYRQVWYNDPSQRRSAQLELFPQDPWQLPRPKLCRLVSLCSGYDSQAMAFDVLRQWAESQGLPPMDWELTAWSEFDPESKAPLERQPAVVAHDALWPAARGLNLGDMTKADWKSVVDRLPEGEEIDLLTYSTPCTDISQAGKRQGIAPGSGTRSAILWHTEDAIRTLRPRLLLQENVAALVNQQNDMYFRQWRDTVSRLGYRSSWLVLNARDYGLMPADGPVPQNRERLFMLSWRNDLGLPDQFPWPEPMQLSRTIADVLDDDVPPSFFLRPESVISFLTKNTDGDRCIYRTTDHEPTPDEVRQWVSEAEA